MSNQINTELADLTVELFEESKHVHPIQLPTEQCAHCWKRQMAIELMKHVWKPMTPQLSRAA
ncbi:MAG TPA: hypothetical protein V6D17_00580 [Candidatus Obscuribacterales bacterium]